MNFYLHFFYISYFSVIEKEKTKIGTLCILLIFSTRYTSLSKLPIKRNGNFTIISQKLFQPFSICNSLSTSTLVERISLFRLSLVFLINQDKVFKRDDLPEQNLTNHSQGKVQQYCQLQASQTKGWKIKFVFQLNLFALTGRVSEHLLIF